MTPIGGWSDRTQSARIEESNGGAARPKVFFFFSPCVQEIQVQMLREPGDHVAAARRREEETWTGVGEDWLDSLGESEPLDIGRPLAPGQRVRVFGGYDTNPAWLQDDPDGYGGVVASSSPAGTTSRRHRLDVPLFAGGSRRIVVLESLGWHSWGQRHRESTSNCDQASARWRDRRRGAWIESRDIRGCLGLTRSATSSHERCPRRSAPTREAGSKAIRTVRARWTRQARTHRPRSRRERRE